MNLILSRASRDYVLQVTGGRSPQTILFCAQNGIAAMSYAGLDRIGGMPTGQWLAEALPQSGDLGRALTTLARALSAAPVELDSAFDLHVAGWQWSGKQWSGRRCRPVIAGLSKDPGIPVFKLEYLPRYWFLDRGKLLPNGRRGFRFNVTAAPDRYISRPQLQRVVDRLRDTTPDDAESILAGAIRGVSESVPEAGPQRLSVLLLAPGVGQVRVRAIGGALSPWLVSRDGIAAPMPLAGTFQVHLGPYTVTLESPVFPQ